MHKIFPWDRERRDYPEIIILSCRLSGIREVEAKCMDP